MALNGLKVVEFAGLAPGPFTGLILADAGASVTRIDRLSSKVSSDILCRGKRSIAVNTKVESGRDILRRLIQDADVVIDPFRPGVLERLGLGPDVFLGDNEGISTGTNRGLIYARIVGFSRTGPHKNMAGHDINYLALSGILSMLPGEDKPTFPLNLLADFAGGGLMCALGILFALIERGKSGKGQVVNADMVSGTRYISLFALSHVLLPSHLFSAPRGGNILDGGAPFYDIYCCKDGRWMSVGCLEPQFFKVFIEKFVMALPKSFLQSVGWIPTAKTQSEREQWSKLRAFLKGGFETASRDHWAKIFHGTDACALPVLTPAEAGELDDPDSPLPGPHPELVRTRAEFGIADQSGVNLHPGEHTVEILQELGIGEQDLRNLISEGVLAEGALNGKL